MLSPCPYGSPPGSPTSQKPAVIWTNDTKLFLGVNKCVNSIQGGFLPHSCVSLDRLQTLTRIKHLLVMNESIGSILFNRVNLLL